MRAKHRRGKLKHKRVRPAAYFTWIADDLGITNKKWQKRSLKRDKKAEQLDIAKAQFAALLQAMKKCNYNELWTLNNEIKHLVKILKEKEITNASISD